MPKVLKPKPTTKKRGRQPTGSQSRVKARPGKGPATGQKIPSFTDLKLRTLDGSVFNLHLPDHFPKMASDWEYRVRNRIRWSDNKQALETLPAKSADALQQIGISAADLGRLAKAGAIEVEIPYTEESQGWELRIFPWEFLLTSATVRERKSAPLVVVRHLVRMQGSSTAAQKPKSAMVVTSAPGKISDIYSFESERKLVQACLGLREVKCPPNSTLAELRQSIASEKPDVIHLAGVDSSQGGRLLGETETTWDGYYVSSEDGAPTVATAEQLGPALKGGGKYAPALVACNFYYSASRVAALIVAEGAHAAIGFQDEIDDAVAEKLFAGFYFAWKTLNWDLLAAFSVAVRDTDLQGAGVVLWTDRRLLAQARSKTVLTDIEAVHQKRREPAGDISRMEPRDLVEIKPKPKPTVNYSLLQNNENIFDEFTVRKLWTGPVRGITVKVILCVGSDSFPFQTMLDLEEPVKSLEDDIRIPLTSAFARSLRESVQTVLAVEVSWNGKICYLNTFRVALLAIDEWVDTPELDAYLPSFVLPRDKTVARTIDMAQRYLMSLNDDSAAGFDGYQGVGLDPKNPTEGVDLQVRAIWSALLYESPLSYVNPPPTFTERSQRLRTPGDVVEGRRGTCIDLALLLAACCEYAGIYPLVFLLAGHAFPGYWRSDKARQKFIEVPRRPISEDETRAQMETRRKARPPKPWVFNDHAEVVQLVRSGDVIPLETVWLTEHKGFWEAVDAGMDNLRSKREFACMIDVQGARDKNVTPLPILSTSG
ncbi:MAG TPA: CHAT domain-containing protein [Terriglobales bacterium]|nr:CHAT domain-containing protein [Terriglobales bacterium]